MDNPNGLENIKQMYEKLTYFDQYGSSVIMLIIITILLIIVISYSYAMINAQPIIDDWPNQRCKPQYLPIAGFITHPEGVTATEYTAENLYHIFIKMVNDIGWSLEENSKITVEWFKKNYDYLQFRTSL